MDARFRRRLWFAVRALRLFALALLALSLLGGASARAQSPPPRPTASASPPPRWTGSTPDPAASVPLASVGGGLYALWAVFALGCLAFGPMALPWLCPIAAPSPPGSRRARALHATADALAMAAAFAVAFWFARAGSAGHRILTVEHEQCVIYADLCVAGRGCPLAGQIMGNLAVRLGPLYYVLLSALRLATHDLVVAWNLIVIGHAAAAALVTLLATRLFGRSLGLLAGLLLAVSGDLVVGYQFLTHAPFLAWPLAGFAWATLAYVRGGGPRALTAAVGCLALAAQMHGISLVFAPILALLALLADARPSRRELLVAAGAWVALQAPWFAYYARTGPGDFLQIAMPRDPPMGQAYGFLPQLGSLPTALTLGALAVLAAASFGRPASPTRATARALALLVGLPGLLFLAWRHKWHWQYGYVFLPFAPLAWAAALRALVTAAPPVARRPGLVALLSAATALAVGRGFVEPVQQFLIRRTTPTNQLSFDDEVAVVRALEAAGVRGNALDGALHGALSDQLKVRPRFIAAAPASPTPASVQALLLAGCPRLPEGFADRQRVIASGGHRYLLALGPALRPRGARLLRDGRVVWSGPAEPSLTNADQALLYDQLARHYPGFGASPMLRAMMANWHAAADVELQLDAALPPRAVGRRLVVAHDPSLVVRVEINGAAVAPAPTSSPPLAYPAPVVREAFAVGASPSAEQPLRVVLRPAPTRDMPQFLDIYEAPEAPCGSPE